MSSAEGTGDYSRNRERKCADTIGTVRVLQNKFVVSFIIIFGTLSFPITQTSTGSVRPFLQGAQSYPKQTERKLICGICLH